MSLNNTPSSERTHIGIFGKRNAGKSSVINAITGQELSIVSEVKGTTTDPVLKSMELLPLGPVVIIDTPGLDDVGELGVLRIKKAYQMLNKTDIAVLVVDGTVGVTKEDEKILTRIQEKQIPYVIVFNKADLLPDNTNDSFIESATFAMNSNQNTQELTANAYPNLDEPAANVRQNSDLPSDYLQLNSSLNLEELCEKYKLSNTQVIAVSATEKKNIHELKELIAHLVPDPNAGRFIVRDLIAPMDLVVLVVPIDASAPKGRLILPQQQTIRDILEAGAVSIVVRDTELKDTLAKVGAKPALVITDSQAFGRVSKDVPSDIPLTSFSILFARYKGNLKTVVAGAKTLDTIENGDKILVCEGCTHHRQCEDIGTVKLPNWIRKHTGRNPEFVFTSGTEFPDDLSPYKMVIHCGGCTLNEREMKYRLKCAEDAGIPITNYGTAIAYMNGILKRSTEIFTDQHQK